MTTPTPPESITTRYDSAWSATVAVTTAPDETAPPQPSAPKAAGSGTSALFAWDGLGRFGEAMPADLEAAELHLSTSAGFTPTSPTARSAPGYSLANDTYRGDIVAGRPLAVGGLTSGIFYYAVLVARDTAGNRSAPSPTTSV